MTRVYALPLSGKVARRYDRSDASTLIQVDGPAGPFVYRRGASRAWECHDRDGLQRRTLVLQNALYTLDAMLVAEMVGRKLAEDRAARHGEVA